MIIKFLFISLAIQILLFIPAYKFRTDKLTDLTYGLTFILLSLISFLSSDISLTKILLLLLISIWGLRLGIYLFIRINRTKKDSRFDNIRSNPAKFIGFWILQGVTVFIVLIPSLFYFQSNTMTNYLTFYGLIVWLVGLLIEGFADQQKFIFIKNEKNKDKPIEVGFWKYSRHPNYLGEIICWLGIYIYTFSSVNNIQKIVGIVSPLWITVLPLFISGIPILEKKANEKWRDNKRYQDYKKKTAILIPFIY